MKTTVRLGDIVTFLDATGWKQADEVIARRSCPSCGQEILLTSAGYDLEVDGSVLHQRPCRTTGQALARRAAAYRRANGIPDAGR